MSDEDIYADLPEETTGDYIQKLETSADILGKKLELGKKRIDKLETKVDMAENYEKELEAMNIVISTNMNSLYQTAHKEIEKKSTKITQLQKEKDDIIFGKNIYGTSVENKTINYDWHTRKEKGNKHLENNELGNTANKSSTHLRTIKSSNDKGSIRYNDFICEKPQLKQEVNSKNIFIKEETSIKTISKNRDETDVNKIKIHSQCEKSVSEMHTMVQSNKSCVHETKKENIPITNHKPYIYNTKDIDLQTPLKFINGECNFNNPFSHSNLLTPFKDTPDMIKVKFNNDSELTNKSDSNQNVVKSPDHQVKKVFTKLFGSNKKEQPKENKSPISKNITKTYTNLFISPLKGNKLKIPENEHSIGTAKPCENLKINFALPSKSEILLINTSEHGGHFKRNKQRKVFIISSSKDRISYGIKFAKNIDN